MKSATARLIQCAEKVSQYLEKVPVHGSLDGTSTISTKLVEWPVVESVPARVVVLYYLGFTVVGTRVEL